jgi:hypothetical protein
MSIMSNKLSYLRLWSICLLLCFLPSLNQDSESDMMGMELLVAGPVTSPQALSPCLLDLGNSLPPAKLKSEHSKGRAIMVQFQSSEIDRFHLSIPITDTCDEGCLFVKAIKHALEEKQEYEDDQEQCHHQWLSSREKTSSPSNNTVAVACLQSGLAVNKEDNIRPEFKE